RVTDLCSVVIVDLIDFFRFRVCGEGLGERHEQEYNNHVIKVDDSRDEICTTVRGTVPGMRDTSHMRWLPISVFCALQAFAGDRIGHIEFFGYKGIDPDAVREALPVREGALHSDSTETIVREAVVKRIGRAPTDISVVCCDDQGNRLLFIGLPGDSYTLFRYLPEPNGAARMSSEIVSLYDRLDDAI